MAKLIRVWLIRVWLIRVWLPRTVATVLTLLGLTALLAGCSSAEPAAESAALESVENGETAEPSSNGGAPGVGTLETATAESGARAPFEIDASAHATNTLIALVTVTTEMSAPVHLRIESSDVPSRTISLDSEGSPDGGIIAQAVVVGLRAETEYLFTAVADDGQSSTVTFTSGALPTNAPIVEVIRAAADPATEGITFFGLRAERGSEVVGPAYYGVDSEGHVVWYLDNDQRVGANGYIRNLGGGEILAAFNGSVERLTLDGTVVQRWDLSAFRTWHHDVRLVDNAGLMFIARENRTVNGQDVLGDVIIEIDANGNIVWEWSTFDHLDSSRFPTELSNAEARSGGLDWTHANAIWVDGDEVLLSVRSQSWVVSIDRVSSEINWIAGDRTGVAADFDAPFLTLESGTWTSAQHAAMFNDAGELVVYDNSVESAGPSEGSRGVIYEIDAEGLTASEVFEVPAGKYTESLGDIDELPNGNVFLTAGGPGNGDRSARLVEFNRAGDLVWEAVVTGMSLYRSERIAWAEIDGVPEPDAAQPTVAQPDAALPSAEDTAVDITDVILTATDESCAAYQGAYSSEITDVSRDLPFDGMASITVVGDRCVLTSNSIPNHDVGEGSRFANDVQEIGASYELPLNPQLSSEPTAIGGDPASAILLNGVVWEAYPAACFDAGNNTQLGRERIGCPGRVDHPWRYNIGSPLNRFGVDRYFAHPQGDGYYHYHKTPLALHDAACAGVAPSPVIGFAKDGFPIFGPCFADDTGTLRTAQSSYVLRQGPRVGVEGFTTPLVVGTVASLNYDGQFMGDFEYQNGVGDLDECNGMTVDGVYGYYLTEAYPYVLACFSGTPTPAENFGRS